MRYNLQPTKARAPLTPRTRNTRAGDACVSHVVLVFQQQDCMVAVAVLPMVTLVVPSRIGLYDEGVEFALKETSICEANFVLATVYCYRLSVGIISPEALFRENNKQPPAAQTTMISWRPACRSQKIQDNL
ncbi:hypothetical protein CBL_13653 [Carabus blaptoides fortunei]